MPNTPNSVVVLDQFGKYPPLGGFSGPVPMLGVTDGSNAAPGFVGEFMSAAGSASIPTSTPTTIATLNLTAGDWDVWGSIQFTTGASQAPVAFGVIIGGAEALIEVGSGGLTTSILPSTIVRESLSVTTAVPLRAQVNWSGGATTFAVSGSIFARRMR